jgi:hypothetical protein
MLVMAVVVVADVVEVVLEVVDVEVVATVAVVVGLGGGGGRGADVAVEADVVVVVLELEVKPVVGVDDVVVVEGTVVVGTTPAISTAKPYEAAEAPWRARRANETVRVDVVGLAPITTRAENWPLVQARQACEYPTGKGWLDVTSSRHDEAPLKDAVTSTGPPKRPSELGAVWAQTMVTCDGWAPAVAVAASAPTRATIV